MIKYKYDSEGKYSGTHKCQPDPINGGYLSPQSCTELPPIDCDEDHYSFFDGVKWSKVVDENKLAEKSSAPAKKKAADMASLRSLRNDKLTELDYITLDAFLGDTTYTKAQIKTYKKALKDITEPYKKDEILILSEVAWPSL